MARPLKKKDDIEKAAIKLFATKGLARTVIKDIAREAEVTEGALYRHYTGKDEMAWKLFTRELEKFAKGLEKYFFIERSPLKERIARIVEYIFQYYQDHPIEFSFVLLTQHGFPEEDVLNDQYNPYSMITRFVQSLIDVKLFREANPVIISAMLIGMVLEPIVMHRYGRLPEQPLEHKAEVIKAIEKLLEVE